MSSRRRHNALCSISVDGAVVEDVQPIRNVVYAHFAEYFQSTNVERPSVANLNFRSLSVSEGVSLIKPFSVQEIKEAVWDCDSHKSPGINFGFIKEFWIEMKDEIVRFVSEFHRNGKLSKGINTTFIALIPKVDSPQKLNDFRLISLAGSLYKILAKLLANRLRGVISSVVSESQSAFVKNRQILDGILIANEAVDEACKFKKELMLFKVDFEKAHDSVDWVNGSPTDEFPLVRGLRQSDLLSPFLFLLAAEGLNVVMKSLVEAQLFSGYSIGVVNPVVVSHLQFADDTLLLGTKSWDNSWLHEAASVLSCKVGNVPFLYLGMPIGGNPRRLCFWEPIVNRIKSRLSGWNSRFLSFGGRLRWFVVYGFSRQIWRIRWQVGGRRVSCWWSEVSRLRGRVGVGGSGWFKDQVLRRVGDEADTSFWFDRWIREAPLRVRFSRLFELTKNKFMSVADLLSVDSKRWGDLWRWIRRLWQWEEELLEECRALLLDVSLNPNVPQVADYALDLVWHKQVPLKVSVFAWRLIRDRLPKRTNLIARRVLSPDMSSCVAGCGHPESAQHLFLLCNTFGSLWHLVRDWIGCYGVDTDNIFDHFLQFTHLTGGGVARRSFMQLIWLLCA
ncbi:uncharacterized protein [Medicago truncatula]|uniref:uncharacterized protein n=1 Tax=Medicago truncatula TaxID=3880 RepID=UPI000D2F31FC|nr:uncharacterized protein LOC112422845 [Medicago truncatula]